MFNVFDFYDIQPKSIPRVEDDRWNSSFPPASNAVNFNKQYSIYSYYSEFFDKAGKCMPHSHNYLEMKIFLDAENYITQVDQEKFKIKAGDILFTNQNEVHSADSSNGFVKRITLGFSPSFLDETIQNLGDNDYFMNFNFLEFFFRRDRFFKGCLNLPEKGFKRVLAQCCQILHTFDQNCADKHILIKNHVLSMLSSLLLEYRAMVPPIAENDHRISTIIFYVQHNFTKPITISDLAAKFFISKSRLYELFKKRTGTSLSAYMNILRLQKARTLLLTTPNNITQIAMDVGFQDISYFNRLFRKKYGASPRKIRNNHTPVQ